MRLRHRLIAARIEICEVIVCSGDAVSSPRRRAMREPVMTISSSAELFAWGAGVSAGAIEPHCQVPSARLRRSQRAPLPSPTSTERWHHHAVRGMFI